MENPAENPIENPEPNKKGFSAFGVFLVLVVLALLGYYGYRALYVQPQDSKGSVNWKESETSYESNEEWTETEEEIYAPEIDYRVTKHQKKLFKEMFKDCNKSKRKLVKACDYKSQKVRNFAVQIAGKDPGNFNLAQICDLFDHLYKNGKYVNDPATTEYLAKASETIDNNLNGDCDDFAVMLCSVILSVGGEARINYAWGEDGGHAFTEVNLGKTNQQEVIDFITNRYYHLKVFGGNLNGKYDNEGNLWLNLDWFAENPGGTYFDYKIGYTFYILNKFCENIDASTVAAPEEEPNAEGQAQ